MHDSKPAVALHNAPLNGREIPNSMCVYNAREFACRAHAFTAGRNAEHVAVRAPADAERSLTLRDTIGGGDRLILEAA